MTRTTPSQKSPAVRFVVRTTLLHAVTYLVVGIIAAIVLDYASIFEEPVVSDYMRPFGSVAVFVGPLVQVARGAIIAVVLLPFREVFGRRHGWLWLWGLLVGVGIVSTSAAAPSSLEGIVYSELPLWYHAIGLPEMLIQTLAFSALVAFYERNPDGALAVLPPVFGRLLGGAGRRISGVRGYAVVSVAFALLAGARIDADENLTLEVQGLFILPFIANGVIGFLAQGSPLTASRRALAGALSYGIGVASLLGYQLLVTGAADPLYGLLAPVIPAIIVALLVGRGQTPRTSHPMTTESSVSQEPFR